MISQLTCGHSVVFQQKCLYARKWVEISKTEYFSKVHVISSKLNIGKKDVKSVFLTFNDKENKEKENSIDTEDQYCEEMKIQESNIKQPEDLDQLQAILQFLGQQNEDDLKFCSEK